jgi:hypothetical protein
MNSQSVEPRFALGEARLLVFGLVGLVIIAILITLFAPTPDAPTLSVRSDKAEGAMALRLWLERSGYRTGEMLSDPVVLDDQDAHFILNPLVAYTETEANQMKEWVRDGHTLIVAGSPSLIDSLTKAFNVKQNYIYKDIPDKILTQAQPILLQPPVDSAEARPGYSFSTTRTDVIVYAYTNDEPSLISIREGRGMVWFSGSLYMFSNRALHDPNNAAFVLNMLSTVPRAAMVTFDEARHGFGSTNSLQAWLFNTPSGWGVLLIIVLTMTFLAMRGRRFGRAVPLPDDRLRREPVEYIQAMATLFRRSGQRGEMLTHYRAQLRRRLTERFAIDPNLSDVELVKTAAFRDPTLDAAQLRDLLARLAKPRISEAELIAAAADVDRWLKLLR